MKGVPDLYFNYDIVMKCNWQSYTLPSWLSYMSSIVSTLAKKEELLVY